MARTVIVWLIQADDASMIAMAYVSDIDPFKFIAEYTLYLFYCDYNDRIWPEIRYISLMHLRRLWRRRKSSTLWQNRLYALGSEEYGYSKQRLSIRILWFSVAQIPLPSNKFSQLPGFFYQDGRPCGLIGSLKIFSSQNRVY